MGPELWNSLPLALRTTTLLSETCLHKTNMIVYCITRCYALSKYFFIMCCFEPALFLYYPFYMLLCVAVLFQRVFVAITLSFFFSTVKIPTVQINWLSELTVDIIILSVHVWIDYIIVLCFLFLLQTTKEQKKEWNHKLLWDLKSSCRHSQ